MRSRVKFKTINRFQNSKNTFAVLKGPNVKHKLHYELCRGRPFMTVTWPCDNTSCKSSK